jgi:hypothetical protein
VAFLNQMVMLEVLGLRSMLDFEGIVSHVQEGAIRISFPGTVLRFKFRVCVFLPGVFDYIVN